MREINRVAVIGAGVIGASFALLFAKNGLEVNLYDISKDALDAGINNISKNVDTLIDMGLVTSEEKKHILERVKAFDSLKDALSDVDFIQENGPERINIKRNVKGNRRVRTDRCHIFQFHIWTFDIGYCKGSKTWRKVHWRTSVQSSTFDSAYRTYIHR